MWFLEVLSIRVHMALFGPDDLILINVLPNAWWCWIWSQFSPELRPAFQMFLLNSYQIIFIDIAVYIAHLSALLFLSLLVVTLVKSVRSSKNLMLLSYAASFSLLCLYLTISFIYLTIQIDTVARDRGPIRVPLSIHFSVASPGST